MAIFRPTRFNVWDTGEVGLSVLGLRYGGGKTQTSSSQVSIPPEVLARYNSVNAKAEDVSKTPFQTYSTDPNAFVAPLSATQQAGIVGTNQYSSAAQPFYQQASDMTQAAAGATGKSMGMEQGAMGMTQSALNPAYANTGVGMTMAGSQAVNPTALDANSINKYLNPYTQDVANTTGKELQNQYDQAQSGQLGNAINNGAFGGDRAGIAAANLQNQEALAYGATMAPIYQQGYTTALSTAEKQQGVGLAAGQANQQRLQTGGQQVANIGNAQQGLNLNQAGQFGTQSTAYGNLANQYGALGNQMGNIGAGAQSAGLAGAQAQLTAGQAQQQTEQAGLSALYNQFLQQQSYPFQTTQFLANIAEGTGALSGSTTTSTSPQSFFSDERLKEDIKEVGKLKSGEKIVQFRYKGSPHKQVGLIAQDVEKHHPEAVGLAGGYKTVDYGKVFDHAARASKASGGGLVGPESARMGFSGGGLSPNSAAEGGFSLDPSYLSAMEQSYANAPWGGVGAIVGGSPYGGKSHVPPSSGGTHAQLAVAQPPKPSSGNTLQDASKGLGQVVGLAKEGQSFKDKYFPPSSGGAVANTAPAANNNTPPSASGLAGGTPTPPEKPADVTAAQTHDPEPSDTTNSITVPANAGPGSHALNDAHTYDNSALASLDNPDDLSQMFSDTQLMARGGLIGGHGHARSGAHRSSGASVLSAENLRPGLAGGGQPSFNQPTDATSQDQSDGGDIPGESGTGMKGFDIPDDRPNNKLAVADPPSSKGGGSGLGDVAAIAGDAAKIIPFFLARGGLAGGRHGYADGGLPTDGTDAPPSDSPSSWDKIKGGLGALFSTGDPVTGRPVKEYEAVDNPDATAFDPNPSSRNPINREKSDYTADGPGSGPDDPSAIARGKGLAGASEPVSSYRPEDSASTAGPYDVPLPPRRPSGLGEERAATGVAPPSAKGGDFSAYAASPPKSSGIAPPGAAPASGGAPASAGGSSGLSAQDMGMRAEAPGQDAGGPMGWVSKNQDWLVPLLHGIGTMASSNSRYLGSAILQGIGGAADSYEQTQNQMQGRQLNDPIVTQRNIETTGSLYEQYARIVEMAKNNHTIPPTFEEFKNGVMSRNAQTVTSGSSPQSQSSSPGGTMAAPANPANAGQQIAGGNFRYDDDEMRHGTVVRDGKVVPLANDAAYLQAFLAENKKKATMFPQLAGSVQFAEDQLNRVSAGRTYDASGNLTTLAGAAPFAAQQAGIAGNAANVENFTKAKSEVASNFPNLLQNLRDMGKAYGSYHSGTFGPLTAEAAKALSYFGLSGSMLNDPNAHDVAAKTAARSIVESLKQLPGGAPAAELGALSEFAAHPDQKLQPEAVRSILLRGMSALERQNDLYSKYDPRVDGPDVAAYMNKFNSNPNTSYDAYMKRANKEVPWLEGMAPAHVRTRAEVKELPPNAPFIAPDGELRYNYRGGHGGG